MISLLRCSLSKTQITTNTPSPNVADVNGTIHGLYLRSDISTNSIYDSETKSLSAILARLPIRVNFGGVIFWDTADGTGHKAQVDSQIIKNIRIRLTDDRNRLIDLNGLNFSLTILIDFAYKKEKIQPLNKETRRIRELHLEHKAREKHQRLHKKDKSKGGRPRIAPLHGADNENLKASLGVSIKGMTAEQRRAYNRLAKRKEYAREQQRKYNQQTSQDFKKRLGKKIKDMTDKERRKYYQLAKQEQRVRDK